MKPIMLLTGTWDWPYPHMGSDFHRHGVKFLELHTIEQVLKYQDTKYACILYPDNVIDDDEGKYNEKMQRLIKEGKIYLPVVLLACDSYDRPHVWKQSYDFIMWYTAKGDKGFKEQGKIENCIYLGFGCNPCLYYKENIRKDIDVSLISRAWNTDSRKLHYVKWFENSDIKLTCDGGVFLSTINRYFNRSKINLDISVESMEKKLYVLKMRVFEVTMSGNFLLAQWSEQLEDNFVIGKEIETWRTKEELFEKIRYYLKNETEREQIARRGWERCNKEYTWAKRLEVLLKFIEK